MKQIDIKGAIVSSDDAWIYEWYGMEAVSPDKVTKALLNANNEPVKVIINSGGGSVFAGYEIYNSLRTYSGKVTIEVHGLAASIASVIAMAGECNMSPVSQMMIHNVSTMAKGDYRTMEHSVDVLKKSNSTIAGAYALKSGKDEKYFLDMMNNETWFTAKEALSLGLIDGIMFSDSKPMSSSAGNYKSDKSSLAAQMLQQQINLLKLKHLDV